MTGVFLGQDLIPLGFQNGHIPSSTGGRQIFVAQHGMLGEPIGNHPGTGGAPGVQEPHPAGVTRHEGALVGCKRHIDLARPSLALQGQRPCDAHGHLGIANQVFHVALGGFQGNRCAPQVGELDFSRALAQGTPSLDDLRVVVVGSIAGDAGQARLK